MTYRPARRLADIEPFHVVELLTRARQLESEGRDIIHMEVGEPDFPTPEPIARAAAAAIQGGKTLYTQALGLPGLDAAGAGEPLYRITVDLSAQTIMAYGEARPLQIGMQLEADIMQERRKLYEWVLEPLISITGKL